MMAVTRNEASNALGYSSYLNKDSKSYAQSVINSMTRSPSLGLLVEDRLEGLVGKAPDFLELPPVAGLVLLAPWRPEHHMRGALEHDLELEGLAGPDALLGVAEVQKLPGAFGDIELGLDGVDKLAQHVRDAGDQGDQSQEVGY